MATAILRPQDCLHNRFYTEKFATPSTRARRNPNPNANSMRSRRRKRSTVGFQVDNVRDRKQVQDRTAVARFPAKNLVIGQVKILRRGEELNPVTSTATETSQGGHGDDDLVLSSADRLGPEPEMVQKQVRVSDGLYAGSAVFLASPPPSSLPFPAFFAKKERMNDAATSDLRRLLRLDLL